MLRPVYIRQEDNCEHEKFQKNATAERILLLACSIEYKTHLCNSGVAFQALSQGLSSFNTQIIGAGVDHCDTAIGLQAVSQDDTTTRPQLTVLHVHPCDGVVSYLFDGNVTE